MDSEQIYSQNKGRTANEFENKELFYFYEFYDTMNKE